jgi:hypothetical protein
VPPNAQPHQRLMVQVPSGQRVNVQLPAVRPTTPNAVPPRSSWCFLMSGVVLVQGAAPGMRMRVAVPTAPHGVSLPPMDAVAKLLGDRGKGVRWHEAAAQPVEYLSLTPATACVVWQKGGQAARNYPAS